MISRDVDPVVTGEFRQVHTDMLPPPALPPVRSEPMLAFSECPCFRCQDKPAETCPGDCDHPAPEHGEYDCLTCTKHDHCEVYLDAITPDPDEYWDAEDVVETAKANAGLHRTSEAQHNQKG